VDKMASSSLSAFTSCNYCGKTFSAEKPLSQHMAAVHPFTCSVCVKSFKTQGALDQHLSKSTAHKTLPSKDQRQQAPCQPASSTSSSASYFPETLCGSMASLMTKGKQSIQSSARGPLGGHESYLQFGTTQKIVNLNALPSTPLNPWPSQSGMKTSQGNTANMMIPLVKSSLSALEHENVLELLSRHCHSPEELVDNHYICRLYSQVSVLFDINWI